MAFNDTYRESIQNKHISNVGFSSTAKGITNEAYALKNPHGVIASQIPIIDIVAEHGPTVASGIAAGIVEKYTVKLTADPTVNNNKAWIAYADNCIEPGHSGAAHSRVDQWLRFAETQYKLRLFEDTGANAPDYTSEIFPTEGTFNWEYDFSAGIVYIDEDPSLNGKTLPLWGEFYVYIGETVADKMDTTSSGVQHSFTRVSDGTSVAEADSSNDTITFLPAGGLDITVNPITDTVTISGAPSSTTFIGGTDTPNNYEDGSLIFSTATGIEYATELSWDDAAKSLSITNSGTLGFSSTSGAYINEFSTDTTFSGNSDIAVPTEKAVKTYVDEAINDNQLYNVDLIKNENTWEYNGGFTTMPTNLVIYYNGVRNKSADAEYYTVSLNAGVIQVTFNFTTHVTDWVTATYGRVDGGILVSQWKLKVSDFTTLVGDRIIVDTSPTGSNGVIYYITLPLNPVIGNEVVVLDAGYNCATTKVVVKRNGSNIMGVASDMDIDANGTKAAFVYYNNNRGWVLK